MSDQELARQQERERTEKRREESRRWQENHDAKVASCEHDYEFINMGWGAAGYRCKKCGKGISA